MKDLQEESERELVKPDENVPDQDHSMSKKICKEISAYLKSKRSSTSSTEEHETGSNVIVTTNHKLMYTRTKQIHDKYNPTSPFSKARPIVSLRGMVRYEKLHPQRKKEAKERKEKNKKSSS